MDNIDFNNSKEVYLKALELAIEIQNKGLATVFFDSSGHVNQVSIDIHAPFWISGGVNKVLELKLYGDIGCEKENNQVVKDLENFLNGTSEAIAKVAEQEKIRKANRLAEYNKLKQEFEQK